MLLLAPTPTELGRAGGDDRDSGGDEEAAAVAPNGLPYTDAARCNDEATDEPIPLPPSAAAAAAAVDEALGEIPIPTPLALAGVRGPLPDDAT